MKQITLNVSDEKLNIFLEFIQDLNYVEILSSGLEMESFRNNQNSSGEDFFALSGMWKDRNVTQEKLREKAWPQRK